MLIESVRKNVGTIQRISVAELLDLCQGPDEMRIRLDEGPEPVPIDNVSYATVKLIEFLNTEAIKGVPMYVLLAGGKTPKPCYELLGQYVQCLTDEAKKLLYLGPLDERCVPDDDPDFNRNGIIEQLGDLVGQYGIPHDHVVWYNFMPDDVDLGVQRFMDRAQRKILDPGGSVVAIIAGVGPDGHAASWFPDHPSSRDESVGFSLVTDSPKPPATRMTFCWRSAIEVPMNILLFGPERHDAYAAFMDEKVSCTQCPAKFLARAYDHDADARLIVARPGL